MMQMLSEFIIRPARRAYELEELGPTLFTVDKQYYCSRNDFKVRNRRFKMLECSIFHHNVEDGSRLPLLIFLHGNSGNRTYSYEIVSRMLQHKISVLTFDFAGCGLSEGKYVFQGYYEQYDIEDVLEYVLENFDFVDPDKIGIWGRSMGAIAALMYASHNHSASLIIIDSAFKDIIDVIKEYVSRAKVIPNAFGSYILGKLKKSILQQSGFDFELVKPIEYISTCRTPALFHHTSEDKVVPPYHSRDLYNAYPAEKEYLETKGSHNTHRTDDYYDTVQNFINKIFARKKPEQLLNLSRTVQPFQNLGEQDCTQISDIDMDNDLEHIRNNPRMIPSEIALKDDPEIDVDGEIGSKEAKDSHEEPEEMPMPHIEHHHESEEEEKDSEIEIEDVDDAAMEKRIDHIQGLTIHINDKSINGSKNKSGNGSYFKSGSKSVSEGGGDMVVNNRSYNMPQVSRYTDSRLGQHEKLIGDQEDHQDYNEQSPILYPYRFSENHDGQRSPYQIEERSLEIVIENIENRDTENENEQSPQIIREDNNDEYVVDDNNDYVNEKNHNIESLTDNKMNEHLLEVNRSHNHNNNSNLHTNNVDNNFSMVENRKSFVDHRMSIIDNNIDNNKISLIENKMSMIDSTNNQYPTTDHLQTNQAVDNTFRYDEKDDSFSYDSTHYARIETDDWSLEINKVRSEPDLQANKKIRRVLRSQSFANFSLENSDDEP